MAKDKSIPSNLVFTREKFKYDTIEDMRNDVALKIGDVVELNGYYEASDGADHKRKIEAQDDGSGVMIKNVNDMAVELTLNKSEPELYRVGLYANIVHNGEVNVSWFGAKGDGITDDTETIRKIFNYKAENIVFQKKKYLISGIFNFNNVKYNINFNNAEWLISKIGNSDLFTIQNSEIKLNNLTINKTQIVDKCRACIFITLGNNKVTINNLYLDSCFTTAGVKSAVLKSNNDITITNNYLNGGNEATSGLRMGGAWDTSSSDNYINIENNYVTGFNDDCITVEGTNWSDFLVFNNKVIKSNRSGITLFQTRGGKVCKNKVVEMGNLDNSKELAWGIITSVDVRYAIISENEIVDCSVGAISLDTTLETPTGINNTTTAYSYNKVIGNTIIHNKIKPRAYGTIYANGTSYTIIENNNIYTKFGMVGIGCYYSIGCSIKNNYLEGSFNLNNSDDIYVLNNTITPVSLVRCLYSFNSGNIFISGNTIISPKETTDTSNFQILEILKPKSDHIVKNNIIKNCVNRFINAIIRIDNYGNNKPLLNIIDNYLENLCSETQWIIIFVDNEYNKDCVIQNNIIKQLSGGGILTYSKVSYINNFINNKKVEDFTLGSVQ